jgi:GMP synthase (glutamine-hydrolysing)
MKAHILQHVHFETAGIIETWLKNNRHEFSVTRFYLDEELPESASFDWLIIMGGPMGVYDEDKIEWLKKEKAFIREAISNNKVVIGICLGAQLIASALNAVVFPNKEKEIGWLPVKTTVNKAKNDLFSSFPEEMTVFHWHGDTFNLPEGAVLIAESDACKNQLFVLNDRVIGIQFHLEVTENSVKGMVENCRNELIPAKYIQSDEQILSAAQFYAGCNQLMFDFLNNLYSRFPGN